jgi:hypothetical protein
MGRKLAFAPVRKADAHSVGSEPDSLNVCDGWGPDVKARRSTSM